MVAALDAPLRIGNRVITQVVEAELRVGPVGDFRLVSGLAQEGVHPVLDKPRPHAQGAVDLAHPLAVTLGEVVVDGHNVNIVTGKRV